ncbi:unnamed protein product [Pedinophyceae sp. YPF-701]|nr:unnamed protein product [Pedinophyceae sp. YPF-701]
MSNGAQVRGKRVAVVGSGITGLSCAWLLQKNGAEVTLFEKEPRCGGHTWTDHHGEHPIDLGFQVFNLTTYPHLVGLFDELGVDSEPSDMSFSLSLDGGRLEWSSDAIFGQRSNMLSPSFLGMLRDVVRFGNTAPEVLEGARAHLYETMTVAEYLRRNNYGKAFVDNYLLPMCAAVWSVPNDKVLAFPVRMLVRFWVNHHLLDIMQRPVWRVVKGRSETYVKRILADLPDVRTSTPVHAVYPSSSPGKVPVEVETAAGKEPFDLVVMACHTDTTLRALGPRAPPRQKKILEAIPYNSNDVVLHTDESLMPARRECWSAWNFLGRSEPHGGRGESDSGTGAVCVTYWCNRLQNLPDGAPTTLVTLNPIKEPDESKILFRTQLDHPVFSFGSQQAQASLPECQGDGGVYLCGAWAGYGFHEDGLRAAIAVAKGALGCRLPWTPRAVSPKTTWWQRRGLDIFDMWARHCVKVGRLRVILPTGEERCYGGGLPDATEESEKERWWGKPALDCTVRVFDMDFFWKCITRHDTGVGEAWMDGDWTCANPAAFMAVLTANADQLNNGRGGRGILGPLANWIGDRMLYLAHLTRANTLEGSRKNIEEHYDAGNAMYKTFLDDTMTYSSGIHAPGRSLKDAQLAKLDEIIRKAQIGASDHVLEIGCGWGSFAIRAASTTGCRVTGLTLSKEQLSEATRRVQDAGLDARVTLLYCDYRDCPGAGTFDRVVSIEMIEAVGHENLPTYFGTIARMLRPGGRAVIQAISEPDERYDAYCNSSDFIREHIFPGGHLPCVGACVEACRGTGLALTGTDDIGPHYAVTLREWRQEWEKRKGEVLALGYSERFYRKYQFYFAYCEAAFDARYIHNYHMTLVKDANISNANATGGPTYVDGTGAAAAQGLGKDGVLAAREEDGRDLPSQAVAALWFFGCGLLAAGGDGSIVGGGRVFAVAAVAAAAFAALTAVSRAVMMALAPGPMTVLGAAGRADAVAVAVHGCFAALAAPAAAMLLLRSPLALMVDNYRGGDPTAPVLLATCAGFIVSMLWHTVSHRRFLPHPLRATAHWLILLATTMVPLLAKQHVTLLAATLVSEGATLVGGIKQALGTPHTWRHVSAALGALDLACIVIVQMLPLMSATRVLMGSLTAAPVPAAVSYVALAGLVYRQGAGLVRLGTAAKAMVMDSGKAKAA